jgi:hypothetical protein
MQQQCGDTPVHAASGPAAAAAVGSCCRFNAEAFQYMLAQTAAEALMKLGIRATAQNFVLNVQGIRAA